MMRLVAGLFLALVLSFSAQAVDFSLGKVRVNTNEGRDFIFHVDLANTPARQAHGLMHRDYMAMNAGMYFLFPKERIRHFWMKNTLIPLDILFIDRQGQIVSIAANTVPESETVIPSAKPAKYVLEINGGLAQVLGIRPGDTVTLIPASD